MKYIFPFIALTFASAVAYSQTTEEQCARAVLGYLKQKKVIGNGDKGLCLSGVENLPQVNIGLGSDTFPLGKTSEGFNPSDETKKNLSLLMKVFAQKADSVSYVGYADGMNYSSKIYDQEFLGSGTTFTKSDVKTKIGSDPATTKAILAKLSQFKDSDALTFEKVPEVASLVRNFYLAKGRAKAVCEVANGACGDESRLNGFASPTLSSFSSNDKRECSARRRAVIQINGTDFSGASSSRDGTFRPNFSISGPASDKRDLQLAAGLNLFQELKTKVAKGDCKYPQECLEALVSSKCGGDAKSQKNQQDNFRMMLDHVAYMGAKVTDKGFVSSVLNGDYTAVKARLAKLSVKDQSRFSPQEKAEYDLIDTVMNGYSDELIGREFSTKKMSQDNLKELPMKIGNQEVIFTRYDDDKASNGAALWRVTDIKPPHKKYMLTMREIDDWRMRNALSPTLKGLYDLNLGKRLSQSDIDNDRHFVKTPIKYKNASDDSPATDRFNCLSASAAIEEKITQPSGKNMFFEASSFAKKDAMGADKVSIELPISSIPGHSSENAGWVCSKCHSGLKYDDKTKSFPYKPRDYDHHGDAVSSVTAQKKENALSFGTMKALNVYNIDRASLGSNCSASQSVCDCLKNIQPGQGELDKILKSSSKITLNDKKEENGVFKAEVSVLNSADSCLFVPPVAHTCKVDPQGRSKDTSVVKVEETPSCQLFAKMKENFPDFDKNKVSSYLAQELSEGAICKNDLPTTDEEEDCGISSGSKGKTKSSSATEF